MADDAKPYPKSRQLARGMRRYRRKIASPKQWQAIIAAKQGPCRICLDPCANGRIYGRITFHHIVSREDHGDDVAENIAPLCDACHDGITRRVRELCLVFVASLLPAEIAYVIGRQGAGYFERAYGVTRCEL